MSDARHLRSETLFVDSHAHLEMEQFDADREAMSRGRGGRH